MSVAKHEMRTLVTRDATGVEAGAFFHEIVHAYAVADRPLVIAVTGPLGSGKTTMLSAAGRTWGVGVMRSPTYGYVNSYSCGEHKCARCRLLFTSIVHFDLYRLGAAEEFVDFGFFEYFVPGGLVVIEWPGVILSFLRAEAAREAITLVEVSCRYVEGDLSARSVSF